MDSISAAEGIKPSVIVRRALTVYLDGIQPIGATDKKMAELTVQLLCLRSDLTRIGGSLNQLAFAFDASGAFNASQLAADHVELKEEFVRLSELLQEIRVAVKR